MFYITEKVANFSANTLVLATLASNPIKENPKIVEELDLVGIEKSAYVCDYLPENTSNLIINATAELNTLGYYHSKEALKTLAKIKSECQYINNK